MLQQKNCMRIAILAPVPVWLLPGLERLRAPGHYATWLEPLVPAFEQVSAEQGLDLHWITMSQQAQSDLVHKAYGQTFHILARRSMGRQMVTGYITEIIRIRRLLAQMKPDLLHAWGSENVYGLAGAFSGMPTSRRLFTLQGCLTEYVRLLGGNVLFRIQAFYEKPLIRRYRHATAESPGAAKLLQQLNPRLDIALVDYGVNAEFFEADWQPASRPEVLFLGSISKRKGIADLIAVAGRPELAHIKFRIAGEGELRAELEARASANVEWLGKCDRPAVIHHMKSSWALVMPTYADTGPTALKEARVVGLPVVTTTMAGAACYIENSKSGFVIEPGNHERLSESISRICESRDLCIQMGRYQLDTLRNLLHPSITSLKFAQLYQSQLLC